MNADLFLRRVHRVIAALFLITIPPAGYFSLAATGDEVSPVVYFPLLPLLGLTLTGSYLLVRPWVQWLRGRRKSRALAPDPQEE